jgi:Protein of unknown function (DUF3050)
MPELGSMARLQQAIGPLREALATHGLYGSIQTLEDVRTFMEHHVFAVWDFMTLVVNSKMRGKAVLHLTFEG